MAESEYMIESKKTQNRYLRIVTESSEGGLCDVTGRSSKNIDSAVAIDFTVLWHLQCTVIHLLYIHCAVRPVPHDYNTQNLKLLASDINMSNSQFIVNAQSNTPLMCWVHFNTL